MSTLSARSARRRSGDFGKGIKGRSRSFTEELESAEGSAFEAGVGERGLLKEPLWTYNPEDEQTEVEDPAEPVNNAADKSLADRAEEAFLISYDCESRAWSKKRVLVQIDARAFDEGAIRRAFHMKILEWPDRKFVCKFAKNPLEKPETYKQDIEMQSVCQKWADLFSSFNPPKKAAFCEGWLLELPKRRRGNVASVEEFMEGKFVKYTNNRGGVLIPRNTPGAFSHFVYEKSGHKMMVVDIQGCGDYYTDPQVHTDPRKGFGQGNLGAQGMEWFLGTHKCSQVCAVLGLPVIDSDLKSDEEKFRALNQGTMPYPKGLHSVIGPDLLGIRFNVTKEKGKPVDVDSFKVAARPSVRVEVFDKLDLSATVKIASLKPGSHSVGRIAGNTVHLPFLCLSRKHATLKLSEEGKLTIIDHGSTNKTRFAAGRDDFDPKAYDPIEKETETEVPSGSWLNLGGDIKILCEVTIPEEGAEEEEDEGPAPEPKYTQDKPPKFKELEKSRAHRAEIVAMATKGDRLYTGDGAGNLKQWDVATLKELGGRKAHTKGCCGIAITNHLVFTCGMDAKVCGWEFDNDGFMKQVVSESAHEADVRTIEATDDELYSGSSDKSILIWKIGPKKLEVDGDPLLGHDQGVRKLQLSGNRMLFSGGADGTVKLWNLDSRTCLYDFRAHTHYFAVRALQFTGRYTISTDDNKTWKVFDTHKLREVWTKTMRRYNIDAAAVHKDFMLLADEKEVRCVSYDGPRTLATVRVNDCENLAFAEGQNRFFTGAGTGELKMWEWE